jgi:hypothetical protein
MKDPKHKGKSIIPQYDPNKLKLFKYLNHDLTALEEVPNDTDDAPIFVSLRFVDNQFECLFDWDKGQMNDFWGFQRDVHKLTWRQLKQQSGSTGFGYTIIPCSLYPASGIRNELSEDINFFELRVNQKARVHGFRIKSIFYLCWLDRNHQICS